MHQPSCDSNGKFATQQCWDTQGYCWCVDIDGNEVEGTKTASSPVCPKGEYYNVTKNRSSHRRCSVRKGVLRPQPTTLFKKNSGSGVFL